METYKEWKEIKSQVDVMRLVRLIRTSMYAGSATKKATVSYLEAEEALMSYRQGRNTTITDYFEGFKSRVEVYIHLGGEPGTSSAKVKARLKVTGVDENTTDMDEVAKAVKYCQEEYLAIMFLRHSDPIRFGGLIKEIANSHARGSDQYPKTLATAVDLLITYQNPYARRSPFNPNYGLSFATEEENENNGSNSRQGQSQGGGRGNIGRGGGRGRGGRANGRRGAGRGQGRGARGGGTNNETSNAGLGNGGNNNDVEWTNHNDGAQNQDNHDNDYYDDTEENFNSNNQEFLNYLSHCYNISHVQNL